MHFKKSNMLPPYCIILYFTVIQQLLEKLIKNHRILNRIIYSYHTCDETFFYKVTVLKFIPFRIRYSQF